MRRRGNLWALHNVASAYGCRPSEILGVEDPWAAYELDLACLVAGREVERLTMPAEGELGVASSPRSSQLSVEEVLGASVQELEARRVARQFADPRVRPMGKMVVPEGGVW